MGLKKKRIPNKDGLESLWVFHYSKKYNSGRKKIRAVHDGIKLYSGKGKHFNSTHEALYDIFYNELKQTLLYKGMSIQDVLVSEIEFFEFAEMYIARKKAYNTIRNYKRSVYYFDKYLDRPILIKDISLDLCEAFKRWLFKQPKYNKGKTLSNNFIHKIIVQLKSITMAAMKEGLTSLKTNPFAQVDIKPEEIIREYLEPSEIEAFRELDIEDMEYFKNLGTHSKQRTKIKLARDYFLLCYDLGVRHSDLLQLAQRLRNAKLGTANNKDGFIDFETKTIGQKHVKTGQLTFIEVNDNAWNRLESYDFDLPYASSASVNFNLKKLAKHLGITKNVHIHMTNHSITTNLHEMGFSIEEIATWQGKDQKTIRKHYLQKEKFRVSQRINKALNKKAPN